jgi:hypothetical protein
MRKSSGWLIGMVKVVRMLCAGLFSRKRLCMSRVERGLLMLIGLLDDRRAGSVGMRPA